MGANLYIATSYASFPCKIEGTATNFVSADSREGQGIGIGVVLGMLHSASFVVGLCFL